MNTWSVFNTRLARKQFSRLPPRIKALAGLALEDLKAVGPDLRGWDVKRTGPDEYRVRLTYRYRLRFRVLPAGALEIEVFYIGHRSDAYK